MRIGETMLNTDNIIAYTCIMDISNILKSDIISGIINNCEHVTYDTALNDLLLYCTEEWIKYNIREVVYARHIIDWNAVLTNDVLNLTHITLHDALCNLDPTKGSGAYLCNVYIVNTNLHITVRRSKGMLL